MTNWGTPKVHGNAGISNQMLRVPAMVKIDAGGLEVSIGQVTDMNRIPNHGVVWRCEFVFLSTGSKLLDSAVRY